MTFGFDGAEEPQWLAPDSIEEALALRAEHGDEASIVAGGTYLGVLINQGFAAPSTFLSLAGLQMLNGIEAGEELRLGALTTHRTVERSEDVRSRWPALAYTFSLVASPRVRNQATVGGVVADADYASDPPAMLTALNAQVVLRASERQRQVPMDSFILGHYETVLEPDELVTEVRVPPVQRAVYRKFRSRSSEDRPCVAVAAAQVHGELRVAVGAVSERPQFFPDICAEAEGSSPSPALAREIAGRYAERIEPISDSRGSASYRTRVIAVEVRRALEDLAHA